jgi:gamma-glutamyltranspeptidase / glutathione hydrolase
MTLPNQGRTAVPLGSFVVACTRASAGLLALFLAGGPAAAVSPPPAQGDKAMVATSQHLATDVGAEIMRRGGNAIDAAVAVGYALAVTHPCCGNIGGGGFATIHLADGRETFVNFREKAPLAATETMYLDAKGDVVPKASLEGYLSVGVPGTVLGLDTMLARYGTMKRADVMAPAIALARDGFELVQGDVDILATTTKSFASQPNVASVFLKDGRAYRPGERLVQADLAGTLEAIARNGPDAFYKGAIAEKVAAASAAQGGILTRADFEAYTVAEAEPVRCTYRGFTVVSAPPPSSGGTTICQILNIVEGYPMGQMGFNSAQSVHLMTEAMRHAYVDRNFQLGDPDFVRNPLEKLLSKDYAAAIRGKIDPAKASTSKEVQPGVEPHEGTQTTHYSVVDDKGNAVAVTYTINALFGAKVIAGDTGFFLNDEMDDFTVKPGVANLFGLVQGKTNAIAPGKRPLSSMSPTIVARNGKPFLVLGSPGGSRIITITLETMMNVIDHGMNLQEAVDAPRVHHQWLPDQVYVEPFAVSPDTRKLLTDMGYSLTQQAPWGAAEAIMVAPEAPIPLVTLGQQASTSDSMVGGAQQPGRRYGANDNRRPAGAASGY